MSQRRAIAITARREMRERLRSREFRWSTVITVMIVIAIVAAIGLVGDDGPDRYSVGAAGNEPAAIAAAAQTEGTALDVAIDARPIAGEDPAEAAVAAGEIDAAIVDGRLLTRPQPPGPLVNVIQGAARAVRGERYLREQGVADPDIRQALDPPPLAVVAVGEREAEGEGLAVLASLLLFIAILGFGTYLTTGVVEEKTSRVVELIISTIRPVQLLTGKVLGIGVLGIGQVILVAGAGVATALAMGRVDLPGATATTLVLVAVYFMLGYLLYAWGFAVAGAIVSRAEDVQTTTGPLTLTLVVGYVVTVNLVDAPSSVAAQVCTFVPITAPLIGPVRAAQGALPAWELAISLVSIVAAILVMALFASRIYERVVLHMGAPLKLRHALRLAR